MPIKALVFDCDGVILDSVEVKTRAFARLAKPYGEEARDKMILYHKMHGGISRYLKFEWFFEDVLKRKITEKEKFDWGEKFKEYALDEVRSCPLIPGALETLEKWVNVMPLFICSGAPDEEVKMVLKERGLSKFFTKIHGSPPKKTEVLKDIILNDAKLFPDEAVMVGDANTDLQAAVEVGTRFYAVGPELKGCEFPWSDNLIPFNMWVETNREKND